ncbi:hypothetical protein R4J00_08060 [Brachyspira intermedia]|uniref:hypothetical protein n=1 Tax=Brachyspira intermedia TaxID=84377 RepID=UPI0030078A53
MKKILLLITILSLFLIQCGNFVTSSNNTEQGGIIPPIIENYTWNDFKGRYSLKVDEQSTMDIVLFDTGYIQIIMKTTAGNANLGSYYLGENTGSKYSTYSFIIGKGTSNQAEYDINFNNKTLVYKNEILYMSKISTSTDIQLNERVGQYFDEENKSYVTVSSKGMSYSKLYAYSIISDDANTIKNHFSKKGVNGYVSYNIDYIFNDEGVTIIYKAVNSQLGNMAMIDINKLCKIPTEVK